MSTYRHDDDFNPAGVIYLLIVFGVFVGVIVSAIFDAAKVGRFDKSFDGGQLSFEGNFVSLGKTGNPLTAGLPEWMPSASESIEKHPRLYEVKGCVGLTIPEKATGVYASTPYFAPEQVTITVPSLTSGTVNVCVPVGTVVQIVLWTDQ